jgi:isoleucyl-tRNA synthetase
VIADEVNVKDVRLLSLDSAEASSVGVAQRLTVNARAAGPRLGKGVQTVIKAAKTGDWSVLDDVRRPGHRPHSRTGGRRLGA